ncbi:MAG: type II toxin-antitoxin system RelE/ParE family toxin [Chloroflexi bacterium]|nr:type II toxin-antitoxin system RelE/ParE family toxin [Chloroflexota bacterium]
MTYRVVIGSSAEKELKKTPALVRERIARKVLSLEDDPRPRGVRKLSGREEYRIRVGDYRILYTIVDSEFLVTVLALGHRREIYR